MLLVSSPTGRNGSHYTFHTGSLQHPQQCVVGAKRCVAGLLIRSKPWSERSWQDPNATFDTLNS